VARERAAAEALETINAPEFMSLSLRLAAWFDAGIWPETPTAEQAALLDRPLADYARDLLRKRHRKLLAEAAALADPAPAQLHALRIDAKKLRYAAEFFRPIFPLKPARLYVAGLKEVQEVLGALNDAAVARALVPRLALSERDGGPRAAGMIAGWTAAEMAGARQRFAKAWGGFTESRRFWKEA
jgi:CHAD domain-containing protein